MALTVSIHGTSVAIGDTVRVAQKIKEGEKERIQNFEGVVIAIKGNHEQRTITIRRIGTGGIGVEKILPVDLPSIASVVVMKQAQVNRSKLYYMRERIGRSALLLPERKAKNSQTQKLTEKTKSKSNTPGKPRTTRRGRRAGTPSA